MTIDDFNTLVNNRVASCRGKLFGNKNIEYTRNNDKLHNFKVAARMDNETPERALWGMWKKHIVSVKDIIDDLPGALPTEELLTEKIDDMINYCLLLEALITERREK